ncbi:MAG: hypothetical protein ACJAR9_001179, partial [Celeribacter sp.]
MTSITQRYFVVGDTFSGTAKDISGLLT